MKKAFLLIILVALIISGESALAAKARSISSDTDSAYHAQHLMMHLQETNCRATGNYIKTRNKANGSKVVGHLEQADEFILLDISDGWAQIKVTASDKTSPDSWAGMIGWVNSDYVDCTCSSAEYAQHHNTNSTSDSWYGYDSVLRFFYNAIVEKWEFEDILEYGFIEPYYFPYSLSNDGFILLDLNSDGVKELIILDQGYYCTDGEPVFLSYIYTLKNGSPIRILESWTRSRKYICTDGSVYNTGSNGASYEVNYILDLVGSEFVVREGILSGDYEVNGELKTGWFLVDESADFTYAEHEMISEEEAYRRIKQYQESIDRQIGPFISFGEYGNNLE